MKTERPRSNGLSPGYYGNWLVVAGFVTQFVSVAAQNYATGAFMMPMIEEFGWSRAQFILPRSLGQFVMAFAGFFIGTRVDRYGAKPFMLAGLVALSASLFALSLITQWWQWVLLNGVVLSIGAALIGNLVVNVTLSKWFVEMRGRAIAWASMGVSFAGIAVTPPVTWCIDQFGWRAGWQAMALATLVLTLPAALSMRRSPEDHGLYPDGKSLKDASAGGLARARADFDGSLTRAQAMRTRAFYLLVLAFSLFQVLIPVVLLQSIPFMTDAGHSRASAAMAILVASLPAMLTKPVWGWLVDHMDPKPLAACSAFISGVSVLLIVAGINGSDVRFAYAAFALLGIGWGGMIPLQEVIWALYFGRRHLGSVRSAALPFALVMGAGGPLAVAHYCDVVGHYDGAFVAVGLMSIVAAVLILALPKLEQQRPPYR